MGDKNCNNCPQITELNADNAKLKVRLEKLEAHITKLETELRASKRQASPFSRGKKKKKRKKPGRKSGQGTFKNREKPPEDKINNVETPLDKCPDCGGEIKDKKTHENIEIDFPPIELIYTRFITESGFCPCCQTRHRSRHEDQSSTAGGAAGICLSPKFRAIAADMHHRLGVSYAKVAEFFRTNFNINITPGGFCQSDQRLAKKAKPIYEELIEAIRKCCVVHADETGWRIGLLKAWLWVFCNDKITVYTVGNRSHEVVVKILGRDFKGTLHSDCFLAYDHSELADWIKQKCLAHLIKKSSELIDEKTRGAVRFPKEIKKLLQDAIKLRNEKEQISAMASTRRKNKIERRLDELIDENRNFTDPDNARFARRLRKHRAHLFTFLENEKAEPTNNRAERDLRPQVISRKTGACNKTERGAETHSIIGSIAATSKKIGKNVVKTLADIIRAPKNPPPLLAPDTS